jgi:hypothetical protein
VETGLDDLSQRSSGGNRLHRPAGDFDGRFLLNTLLNEAPAPITLLQNGQPPSK